MTEKIKNEAEQLKQREDVSRALQQTAAIQQPQQPARPVETKHKVWLGTYLLLLLGLGVLYYLLRLRQLDFAARYVPLIQRMTLGAMAIILVLAISALIDTYLIGRLEDVVSRYNLRRILRLVMVLVLAFIVISILFANWYTAVVSLGIISLILGFALQTPITSFIGWIYILVRDRRRD